MCGRSLYVVKLHVGLSLIPTQCCSSYIHWLHHRLVTGHGNTIQSDTKKACLLYTHVMGHCSPAILMLLDSKATPNGAVFFFPCSLLR